MTGSPPSAIPETRSLVCDRTTWHLDTGSGNEDRRADSGASSAAGSLGHGEARQAARSRARVHAITVGREPRARLHIATHEGPVRSHRYGADGDSARGKVSRHLCWSARPDPAG